MNTRRSQTLSQAHGFTLVEVLVALLLMSMMAALSWRGLSSMLISDRVNQQAIERTTLLNTVLLQWEEDLTQTEDTQLMPSFDFDGKTLRLTRRHPEGVQLVLWWLEQGQLRRWNSPPFTQRGELRTSYRETLSGARAGGRELTMLDSLAGMQLSFFRNNAWSHPMSSGDLIAMERERAILPPPAGVRLVLQFVASAGGSTVSLVKLTAIPTGR